MSRQLNLFNNDELQRIEAETGDWERGEVAGFLERAPERRRAFRTGAGQDVKRTYTPADVADTPWDDIGLPGRYPFTRGPYPTMYRGRHWTMRQIAGFGTAVDTNTT